MKYVQIYWKKHFFNEGDDLMETLREILNDPNHPENYWISSMNDGRVQCHFCERSYTYVGSLKTHEETKHNAKVPKPKTSKESGTRSDDVESYCNVLFKLTLLHKIWIKPWIWLMETEVFVLLNVNYLSTT